MAQFSRKELLEWINDFFQVNITSVQHLGTGAMYVQIIDSLFPGQVDMDKVDWMAENQYDSLKNLKVLQTSMARFNINPPPTDFEALAKGNITENLEFLRFLKEYWDGHFITENYDPVARRDECMMLKRKRSTERQGRRPSEGHLERVGSVGRRGAPSPSPARTTPTNTNTNTNTRQTPPRSGGGAVDPSTLPPAILQEYREIFHELDMSGNGLISWQELMISLGLGLQRSQSLVNSGDSNGDRVLDFYEFVQIMVDPQTDLSINSNQNVSPPISPHANASTPVTPSRGGFTNNISNNVTPRTPTSTNNTARQQQQQLKPVLGTNVPPVIAQNVNSQRTSHTPTPVSATALPASSIRKSAGSTSAAAEIAQLKLQLDEEMRISKDLESERDFYYSKLCEVEVLCQDLQTTSSDPDLVHSILEILWRPRP